MGAYIALAPVFDSQMGITYKPGHRFQMDDDRGARLVAVGAAKEASPVAELNEAEEASPVAELHEAEEASPDLSALYESMTKAQLADIAKSRGLKPDSKATKAELIALLGADNG